MKLVSLYHLIVITLSIILLPHCSHSDDKGARKSINHLPFAHLCQIFSNRNISLTNYPIVDIFYFVIYNPNLDYISKGYFWSLPATAMEFATYLPQNQTWDTRIHIISDNPSIVTLAKSYHYYGHDLHQNDYLLQEWRRRIKMSVTSFEYEVTLYRWLVINQIILQWNNASSSSGNRRSSSSSYQPANNHFNIEQILCLDGDVLLTMNAIDFYRRTIYTFYNTQLQLPVITSTSYTSNISHIQTSSTSPHHPDLLPSNQSSSFQYANYGLGAISVFSLAGFQAFTSQVFEWFNTPWARIAKQRSRKFYPHFSDMILLKAFILQSPLQRSSCFEGEYNNSRCILQSLQCKPLPFYQEILQKKMRTFFQYQGEMIDQLYTLQNKLTKPSPTRNKNKVISSSSGQVDFGIYGGNNVLPYCFMHFQGKEHKSFMYIYGRALYASLSKIHTVTTTLKGIRRQRPKVPEIMERPYLVHIQNTRKLYYLSHYHTKHRTGSIDNLAYLNITTTAAEGSSNNLSSAMRSVETIWNIPKEIMDYFPSGIDLANVVDKMRQTGVNTTFY